jgi:hypothetical protein
LTRDRKKNNRCGWYHHHSLLQQTLVFATETQSLAASLDDEDALETITTWIHDQDFSGYTIQNYMSTLRVFAATVRGNLPAHFEEIEPSEFVDENPAPLPQEIVEYDAAIEMVKEVDSIRDKALILVQWDGGFRPMEELHTIQRKHVELYDDYVIITLPEDQNGKTDEGGRIILAGAELLRKWIKDDHPVHADPEAEMDSDTFIWTKLKENKLLKYGSMTSRFEAAGERAGLDTKHSAQHRRRSSVSILARQPSIGLFDLRYRYNWSPNSDAPVHYIAQFSEPTHLAVAHTRGREIEDLDQSSDTAPVLCPNCGDWTTRGLDNCVRCSHNLEAEQKTLETKREIEHPATAGEKSFEEMILDGTLTPSDIQSIQKARDQLIADPSVLDKLDEYQVRAEGIQDAIGDDDINGVLGPAGIAAVASAVAGGLAKRWTSAKHAAMSIHPAFEGYPPTPYETAQVFGGVGLLLGIAGVVLHVHGLLSNLASGDPGVVMTLMVSLAVGLWMVHRDLPTLNEALKAAANQ